MSPLTSVVFIVLAVGLTGAIAAFVRDRMRYAGYRDIMRDAITLAKRLNGEIFREGTDLVVSGDWSLRNATGPSRKLPVVIRFSHAENTPGLNLRMGAPATFSLAVFPRAQNLYQDRALVRTPDEVFNTRFECRTAQPTEARLFVSSRAAIGAITQLCRSSQHYLSIGSGAVEFSDLQFPTRDMVQDIEARLATMGTLAESVATMPNADRVRIQPRPHQRSIVLRAAIAVGLLAMVAAIAMAVQNEAPVSEAIQEPIPDQIPQADAELIGRLEGYHLARPEELDGTARAWARTLGAQVQPRIELDLVGDGSADDAVYLLVNGEGERRIVVLSSGRKLYDSRFANLGLAARVPKENAGAIEWQGPKPTKIDGDVILVVRDGNDVKSGLVFYAAETSLTSAAPSNWQRVRVASQY